MQFSLLKSNLILERLWTSDADSVNKCKISVSEFDLKSVSYEDRLACSDVGIYLQNRSTLIPDLTVSCDVVMPQSRWVFCSLTMERLHFKCICLIVMEEELNSYMLETMNS